MNDRNRDILYMRFFAAASWQEVADEIGAKSSDAVRVECVKKALPALAVELLRLA